MVNHIYNIIDILFFYTLCVYSTFSISVFECLDLLSNKCTGVSSMENTRSFDFAEPSASYPWQYQLPLSIGTV